MRNSVASDGRWSEKISVGDASGPRKSTIFVAHLSDFVHSLFEDIKMRSSKANYHGPVIMKPPKSQFYAIQVIVLQVLAKSESA
jgi:hypothetical protein